MWINKLENYYTRHFSVVLVYLSYLSVFVAKSPEESYIVLSVTSGLILLTFVLIQFAFNIFLENFDKQIVKFSYVFSVLTLFALLNLTSILFSLVAIINNHISFYLRFREVLVFTIIIIFIIAFKSIGKFELTEKVINTFIILTILLNIIYGILLSVSSNEVKDLEVKYDSRISEVHPINASGSKDSKKNILLLILDEYSPLSEVRKYASDTVKINLLDNYLKSKGFSVITNRTLKTLTVNSLNMFFNQKSKLTFRNESSENAHNELRYSSVISNLKGKGYTFKNFGFFTIGNSIPSLAYRNPYRKPDYAKLLNYSILPYIMANLREDSTSNGDYNKIVESESLNYLSTLPPNQSTLVYVHFLMPHGPFYWEDEFSYKKRNLINYIEFWNFCNVKTIKYLDSIKDLTTYKIIITGDHGFKFNGRFIDAYLTMSAFYNFNKEEIERISTVQDIGSLLLAQ